MFKRALKSWRILVAALFVVAAPTAALAARGYATTEVNMHAGPGTAYPVVATVPEGAHLTIYGCLSDDSWCDTSWRGSRGWIDARSLDYFYGNRYVYLPDYVDVIDVPVVTFVFDTYWDTYYTGRPWYHHRSHWARYWREHGSYGRYAGIRHHPLRPGQAGLENQPRTGKLGRNERIGQSLAEHERHGRTRRENFLQHGATAATTQGHVRMGEHGLRHNFATGPHGPQRFGEHIGMHQSRPQMMATPHMATSHMATPHTMANLHMAVPHMAAPHMAAPHMAAPHMAAPQMAAPHMSGGGGHPAGGGGGRRH